MPSLRDFVKTLDQEGDLLRIQEQVSLKLEASAIMKKHDGGQALLFEKVNGHGQVPLQVHPSRLPYHQFTGALRGEDLIRCSRREAHQYAAVVLDNMTDSHASGNLLYISHALALPVLINVYLQL